MVKVTLVKEMNWAVGLKMNRTSLSQALLCGTFLGMCR